MAYSHLSLSFAIFFWLSSLKFLKTISLKDWLISVLLVTVAIYAHPMGFIACMTIWITLLFCTVIDSYQKPFGRVTVLYLMIPLLSLMLASPQTFNLFFAGSKKPLSFSGSPKTLQPKQQQARSYREIQKSIFLGRYGSDITPALDKSLNFNFYLKHFTLKQKLFIFILAMTGFVALVKKENSLKLPLIALYSTGFILASSLLLLSPVQPKLFTTLTIFHWRFYLWLQIVFILLAGIGLQFVCIWS